MSDKPDRSAASVEIVLNAIRVACAKNPDIRVGQLISNVTEGDPFYVENDLLVDMLLGYDE